MTVCVGELNGSPSLNLSGDCLHFTNLKQLEGSKVRISPDLHVGFKNQHVVSCNFCFETNDSTYSGRPGIYYEHGLKGYLDDFLSEFNSGSGRLQLALHAKKWKEANAIMVEQLLEFFDVSVKIEEVSSDRLLFRVVLMNKFSKKEIEWTAET